MYIQCISPKYCCQKKVFRCISRISCDKIAICCWNTENILGNAKKILEILRIFGVFRCKYFFCSEFKWINRSMYLIEILQIYAVFTMFFCISQYFLSISATNCHLFRNTMYLCRIYCGFTEYIHGIWCGAVRQDSQKIN